MVMEQDESANFHNCPNKDTSTFVQIPQKTTEAATHELGIQCRSMQVLL